MVVICGGGGGGWSRMVQPGCSVDRAAERSGVEAAGSPSTH